MLSVLGLTLVYAVCFVAIKEGLAFAPPLLFAGLRAIIAGAALLALAAIQRKRIVPSRRDWGWVVALGSVSTTLSFGAMFLSPGRTGAGIASVLGNTQPLDTVVLAALFLGERMTPGKWAALLLGLVGVGLVAYPALAGADAYGLSGAVLALVAAASAASGSVIVKRMRLLDTLLAITGWQLILGSLPLLAASAVVEGSTGVHWSLEFAAILLFLALIGTSLATAGWYWLVQREDVGRITMFLYLVPILGLGIAALAFGEGVEPLEGIGVLVTLGGIGAVAIESHNILTVPSQRLHNRQLP